MTKRLYKASDYIYSGMALVNNELRKEHKKLTSLMLYATTKCQSRCQHCSIWQKSEEYLTLDDIVKIMGSKCITSHTKVGLEGGEFVLHPQADEILGWFDKYHPNYHLLSNCLSVNKVVDAIENHHPKQLYISLDGDRETYKRMRGVDGYEHVVEVIERCKDRIPISLMFCLSPWNSFKDMDYVIRLAKQYEIDVRIGIYNTMSFFDTKEEMMDVSRMPYLAKIPESINETEENFDFVALYDEWKSGRLQLGCDSIFSELVIHSNGNVPLCQNLDVMLGNVHKNSLDEIFNSKRSRKIQCDYSKGCNGCWINYHRKYDIILLRNLERVLPKPVIERMYGKYR